MKLLIKNGRVVDPSQDLDDTRDVLIVEGKIAKIDASIPEAGAQVLQAVGRVIAPGFIDMHVHLREPGYEDKETIRTGCAAAAAGGFTSICCMPNTNPVNDSRAVTEYILARAREEGAVNVYAIGAITRGSQGDLLSEIGDLRAGGCVAISDDGKPVSNALIMRRALEYAGMWKMPVIDHCEDLNLAENGVMHEGYYSTVLGLKGIPGMSEDVMVQRNILIASATGQHVHIAHLSTAGAIAAVREAKRRGVHITCEVAPHHFALTDKDVSSYDTSTKMKPPLRSEEDRQALLAALKDGTVDCIATDHAPHTYDEKNVEYDYAPFGIVGLETAVSLSLDRLVHSGLISMTRLVGLLSTNPARILGLKGKGSLRIGSDADVTLLNPQRKITVDADRFRSKGRNTPFNGWKLKGAPAATIVAGKIVWQE
ncbi:MAG: dihydroorotase [Acidobacteria bacterium]|nr:dihydroorotase [Acidobacteriota bacterium]